MRYFVLAIVLGIPGFMLGSGFLDYGLRTAAPSFIVAAGSVVFIFLGNEGDGPLETPFATAVASALAGLAIGLAIGSLWP